MQPSAAARRSGSPRGLQPHNGAGNLQCRVDRGREVGVDLLDGACGALDDVSGAHCAARDPSGPSARVGWSKGAAERAPRTAAHEADPRAALDRAPDLPRAAAVVAAVVGVDRAGAAPPLALVAAQVVVAEAAVGALVLAPGVTPRVRGVAGGEAVRLAVLARVVQGARAAGVAALPALLRLRQPAGPVEHAAGAAPGCGRVAVKVRAHGEGGGAREEAPARARPQDLSCARPCVCFALLCGLLQRTARRRGPRRPRRRRPHPAASRGSCGPSRRPGAPARARRRSWTPFLCLLGSARGTCTRATPRQAGARRPASDPRTRELILTRGRALCSSARACVPSWPAGRAQVEVKARLTPCALAPTLPINSSRKLEQRSHDTKTLHLHQRPRYTWARKCRTNKLHKVPVALAAYLRGRRLIQACRRDTADPSTQAEACDSTRRTTTGALQIKPGSQQSGL